MSKRWSKKVVLFLLCLWMAGLSGACGENGRERIVLREPGLATDPTASESADQNTDDMGLAGPEQQTGLNAAQAEAAEPVTETAVIVVHVCGAVKRPGIYTLPEGSRLWEAVETAGGVLEDGAGNYLNMAAMLSDGEKVVVPFLQDVEKPWGEAQKAVSGEPAVTETKVDLNQADLEQLMTLPGIGEAKAKAILEYREQVGRFVSVEDVKNVPGIKEGAYAKIKDDIMVSD